MLKFSEIFEFSREHSWILNQFWSNSDVKSSFGSIPRRPNLSTQGYTAKLTLAGVRVMVNPPPARDSWTLRQELRWWTCSRSLRSDLALLRVNVRFVKIPPSRCRCDQDKTLQQPNPHRDSVRLRSSNRMGKPLTCREQERPSVVPMWKLNPRARYICENQIKWNKLWQTRSRLYRSQLFGRLKWEKWKRKWENVMLQRRWKVNRRISL